MAHTHNNKLHTVYMLTAETAYEMWSNFLWSVILLDQNDTTLPYPFQLIKYYTNITLSCIFKVKMHIPDMLKIRKCQFVLVYFVVDSLLCLGIVQLCMLILGWVKCTCFWRGRYPCLKMCDLISKLYIYRKCLGYRVGWYLADEAYKKEVYIYIYIYIYI